MKIFNQTFKNIDEKRLAYKYIDYIEMWLSHGTTYIYDKLKVTAREEEKLLYALFSTIENQTFNGNKQLTRKQSKKLTKLHIKTSLKKGRLRDLLVTMTNLIYEPIDHIYRTIPVYFITDNFDKKYIKRYRLNNDIFRIDPIDWFKDKKKYKNKLENMLTIAKNPKQNIAPIFEIEEKLCDTQYPALDVFIHMRSDGYRGKDLTRIAKIINKTVIRHFIKKNPEDSYEHIKYFTEMFGLLIDTILEVDKIIYGEEKISYSRKYYKMYSKIDNKDCQYTSKTKETIEAEYLTQEQIDEWLNIN